MNYLSFPLTKNYYDDLDGIYNLNMIDQKCVKAVDITKIDKYSDQTQHKSFFKQDDITRNVSISSHKTKNMASYIGRPKKIQIVPKQIINRPDTPRHVWQ
jgi:hypothetical protein